MKVHFRSATSDDAEGLTALARLSKVSNGYPEAWLLEWRDALHFSPDYIAKNFVSVAVCDDILVGVVAVEAQPTPTLEHLWIAPEYQGRGLGRQLVEIAWVVAKEQGWASLRVESDPNAVVFYKRLGAVEIGQVDAPVCGVARSLPVLRLDVP